MTLYGRSLDIDGLSIGPSWYYVGKHLVVKCISSCLMVKSLFYVCVDVVGSGGKETVENVSTVICLPFSSSSLVRKNQ